MYLSEVCRMTFNAVDSDVETPLFYVVRHAHKEAFNFLIKREVSLFASYWDAQSKY